MSDIVGISVYQITYEKIMVCEAEIFFVYSLLSIRFHEQIDAYLEM